MALRLLNWGKDSVEDVIGAMTLEEKAHLVSVRNGGYFG